MRLLLIESKPHEAARFSQAVIRAGHEVASAADGLVGAEQIWRDPPDLILLALDLPVIDGLTVLRRIRSAGNTVPVIVLTGAAGDSGILEAMAAGADDYLAASAPEEEIQARIAAALIRLRRPHVAEEMKFADLVLDPLQRRVRRAEKILDLTASEFALLRILMENPRTPVSREDLTRRLCRDQTGERSRTIEVLVSRLRRKLDVRGEPSLIVTTRNAGYCLGLPRLLRPAA